MRRLFTGCLLLALQAPVLALQPPADTDDSLLNRYVPELIGTVSQLNAKSLAVVDTFSYRKHVTGNDGIDPNTAAPAAQNPRYSFPCEPHTPCSDNTISIPYPDDKGGSKTQAMAFSTTNNAGYTLVDSTGARRLQFALLTIGDADGVNAPDTTLQTAQIWYRVSNGGDDHFGAFKQVIASGANFSAFYPMSGVKIGKNGYQFSGSTLVIASNGGQDVLLPISIAPLDSNDQPIRPVDSNGNPINVTSYMQVRILRGHWRSDGSDLDWEVGQPAQVSMQQSTRGLDETAIMELDAAGHCVIISRGSNQRALAPVPTGHYWRFESRDGCRTWIGTGAPGTPDAPGKALAWDDGSTYYAPAAPPFLYKTSNNRIIFMGANADCPAANSTCNSDDIHPRTRVVAAELDLKHLTLRKRSAVIVDEKDSFDTASVDLIAGNRYQLQSNGDVFYSLARLDSGPGRCLQQDPVCGLCDNATPRHCVECATALPGCPPFPTNWHLLRPTPQASPTFRASPDPSVTNGIKWPAVPTAQKFVIYARNPSKQNFWQLNGEVSGSATTYTLQGLPANNTVAVNVFAVFPNGRVSSSNQMDTTIH